MNQNQKSNDMIKPLSSTPIQAYMDNRLQLFDIIEAVLVEIGGGNVIISTFSTSEEFLRRIFRLKQRGLIWSAEMLIDLKASRKTVNLYEFIKNVFDEVYLAENHSKIILLYNQKWSVSIVTSQNQTRGNRTEAGIISTDDAIFTQLYDKFHDIISTKALKLDAIYQRTNRDGEGTG